MKTRMRPVKHAWTSRLQVFERWSVSGGHMRKPETVETRVADGRTFVCVNKRSSWLCKVVTGAPPCDRPLSRAKILQTIKEKLQDGCRQDVGEGEGCEGEGVSRDLMADLFEGNEKKKARPRRRKVLNPDEVCYADVPLVAPERDADDARRVLVPVLATARNLYVRLDFLEWLVGVMRDQVVNGGVPASSRGATAGEQERQLGISWDFRDAAWQGVQKDPPGATFFVEFVVVHGFGRQTLSPNACY